jgi:hypothetical protein
MIQPPQQSMMEQQGMSPGSSINTTTTNDMMGNRPQGPQRSFMDIMGGMRGMPAPQGRSMPMVAPPQQGQLQRQQAMANAVGNYQAPTY